MAQPVLEDSNSSSTDTCPTLPYGSDSPRPFPPSPVHTVTDSPIRVSPLIIITSDSSSDDSSHIPTTSIPSPIHRSSDHDSSTFSLSTLSTLAVSQTFTSILPVQAINSSANPFYSPHFSRSLPHSGPPTFPRNSPNSPNFGVLPPVTDSIASESDALSYSPVPCRIVPAAKPKPFILSELQPRLSFGPPRRCGRGSRGGHFGRRRPSRG